MGKVGVVVVYVCFGEDAPIHPIVYSGVSSDASSTFHLGLGPGHTEQESSVMVLRVPGIGSFTLLLPPNTMRAITL